MLKTTNKKERKSVDTYQTPVYALEPLLPYLPKDSIIWEPASGIESLLVHQLQNKEYIVKGSDILWGDEYNFFTYEPIHWDVIVINPPYSIKFQWICRCMSFGKPFALLIPFESLASKTFQDISENKTFDILALNRVVKYKTPQRGWDSTCNFRSCWLTYGLKIDKQMNRYMNVYAIDMKTTKYNENNKEIIL